MSAPGASLEDWYKCCGGEGKECGREVNSKAFDVCPECSHEKCDSCGEVERPSPVPEEHGATGFIQQYGGVFHPIDNEQRTSYNYGREKELAHGPQLIRYPRPRPSTRGWWHCCGCGADNDPRVNDWTCPSCYHVKCYDGCYIHQQ